MIQLKLIKIGGALLLLGSLVAGGFHYGYQTASNKYKSEFLEQERKFTEGMGKLQRKTQEVERNYLIELDTLKVKRDQQLKALKDAIKKSSDVCVSQPISNDILGRLRQQKSDS